MPITQKPNITNWSPIYLNPALTNSTWKAVIEWGRSKLERSYRSLSSLASSSYLIPGCPWQLYVLSLALPTMVLKLPLQGLQGRLLSLLYHWQLYLLNRSWHLLYRCMLVCKRVVVVLGRLVVRQLVIISLLLLAFFSSVFPFILFYLFLSLLITTWSLSIRGEG